jgi:hypothetical protein
MPEVVILQSAAFFAGLSVYGFFRFAQIMITQEWYRYQLRKEKK